MANNKTNKRRCKGEGSIFYIESSQLWCAQIGYTKPDGTKAKKKFYSSKNGTKKEAKEKLDKWIRIHEQEEEYDNSCLENIRLDKAMKEWIDTYKKPALKMSSYNRITDTVNNYISPTIGEMSPLKLTTEIIQRDCLLVAINKDLSYSTVHKIRVVLNEYLNFLVATHKLKYNPMAALKPLKQKNFKSTPIRYFSDEEAIKIINGCRLCYSTGRRINPMHEIFVLMLYTGARIGEISSLTWDDIDFDNKTMHIHSTIQIVHDENGHKSIIVSDTPKTDNGDRVIPLHDEAIVALRNLEQEKIEDCKYIYHTKNGGLVGIRGSGLSFDVVLKRVGIEHAGTHSLRHTFVSKLANAFVPESIIASLVGHSKKSITQHYMHIDMTAMREAVNKIEYTVSSQ